MGTRSPGVGETPWAGTEAGPEQRSPNLTPLAGGQVLGLPLAHKIDPVPLLTPLLPFLPKNPDQEKLVHVTNCPSEQHHMMHRWGDVEETSNETRWALARGQGRWPGVRQVHLCNGPKHAKDAKTQEFVTTPKITMT